MPNGYSLRTWGDRFRADGLPSLDACTAVYAAVWGMEEFEDEDWFVVAPSGEVLTELNTPYEHDDGECYCQAQDVQWISEAERVSISAQLGNVAPPLPPHIEDPERDLM